MALVSIKDLSVSFGDPPLFDSISLQIEAGERVCLVGRNGAGKSTLMKLITGEMLPDTGEILRQEGLRIARLDQEIPQKINGTIWDTVSEGLENPATQAEWQKLRKAEKMISQMKLPPDAAFKSLSAGMKRRVLLAAALAAEPDLLILDEPTNHLDIHAIVRMEEFLLRYVKTILFVTHDRMFLQKLASRIAELDRGRLTSRACDYESYLERRQLAVETEEKQQGLFDKKLAKEETWIRHGVKARRTRNEGRVKALDKMRELRQARRKRTGTVMMQAQEAERTGKLVIEAKDVSYSWETMPVIQNFSTVIMRGDKVGIIGPNGCGKTTLLQLLLGRISAQNGKIRHGTHLETAYFDQLRGQLDEDKTVQENIADGNDNVIIAGKPRHIIGYLKDFLFTPERARSPVRILSGGERNRLLLAKLFTKPSNVLVMDEPTNDLDTETLELLEELLIDYSGTLLLVSHDRAFLNNVVTGTLVFEGEGQIGEYAGGYDDWQSAAENRRQQQAGDRARDSGRKSQAMPKAEKPRPQKRSDRLSYNEQRELESLPRRIEALEAEQQELYHQMADPALYQQRGAEVTAFSSRLKAVEQELEAAYQRWEALEEKEK
jgi:ATP-binding cassette subfamily F protein uup